jgi:drug/metabolite transporter (DMT)-like permease
MRNYPNNWFAGASMRVSKRLQAVFWLMAGVFTFSLQDIAIKTVSGSYPVHEVIFTRCVMAIPFILFLVMRAGGLQTIRSPRSGALMARGVLLLGSYTSYFLAFPVMKLADVIALYATVPLFVTALAGPILGEKISLARWGAVGLGFIGALIMVRPGSSVFELASLLPVFSALAYASAQVLARRIGLEDSAAVMSFYQNILYLVAAGVLAAIVTAWGGEFQGHKSLVFLLRQWEMPTISDFLLISACGPIAAIGMTMLGEAYRMEEANIVTSFEYTNLIWGTIWGYLIWAEMPGLNSVIGAGLIVSAGLLLLVFAKGKAQVMADLREPT